MKNIIQVDFKKRLKYLWISLVAILLMSVNTYVYAIEEKTEEGTNLSEAYDERQGIVQIQLVYIDGNNQTHILKRGCGFFIGDEGTGEYVLTNYSGVTLTEDEKNAYLTQFGLESGRLDTKLRAVIKKDITINFSYENGSQAMDLAILRPNDSLGKVTNIRLSEEEHYDSGISVYTLGFQNISDGSMEVIRNEGNLDDWTTINDIHYLKHTAVINENNHGGPLLNEKGQVIGFNVSQTSGGYYYSLQISEVIELLDTLGIVYNSAIVVDSAGLEEAMAEYAELDLTKYTEESVYACDELYEQAENLLVQIEQGDITSYTQENINSLQQGLLEGMDGLEKKGMTTNQLIILFVIIVILLLLVVIGLIILLVIKKRKFNEELEKSQHISPAEKLNMQERVSPDSVQEQSKTYLPVNRTLTEITSLNNTAPAFTETTVLNADALPNPMQDASMLRAWPVLVRLKTGDVIQISKSSFIIGKSSEQADYCISGNTSISRKHICIKRMEDGYYVQDLKTTNGTYVDGLKVSWDKDVRLSNGCIIKMADEEFEFKI